MQFALGRLNPIEMYKQGVVLQKQNAELNHISDSGVFCEDYVHHLLEQEKAMAVLKHDATRLQNHDKEKTQNPHCVDGLTCKCLPMFCRFIYKPLLKERGTQSVCLT